MFNIPAVNNDWAAEHIFESIDTPPQFQEEVRLSWDAVVGPAHELDVSHFPLQVFLSLLQAVTQTHTQKPNINISMNHFYTPLHTVRSDIITFYSFISL